jgi:hypothetical protein
MGEAAVMGSLASVALMIVGVLYLKYLWKRPA